MQTRSLSARFMALILATGLSIASSVRAAETTKLKFDYRDADIVKVLEDYAKATGQKFMIDPNVKGKITIINPEPISSTEAFNQLSSALAANSIGISTQEDVMHVMPARMLQRNFIPVVKQVPPLRPERMYTYIVDLKYIGADQVNRELRILASKDGELQVSNHGNQLLISDWSTNLQRVAAILSEVDQPVGKTGRAADRKTK